MFMHSPANILNSEFEWIPFNKRGYTDLACISFFLLLNRFLVIIYCFMQLTHASLVGNYFLCHVWFRLNSVIPTENSKKLVVFYWEWTKNKNGWRKLVKTERLCKFSRCFAYCLVNWCNYNSVQGLKYVLGIIGMHDLSCEIWCTIYLDILFY